MYWNLISDTKMAFQTNEENEFAFLFQPASQLKKLEKK